MLKLNYSIPLAFMISQLFTAPSLANQFDTFKSTWEFFKIECGLVLDNPYLYIEGNVGADETITVKKSTDRNAYAFTKGNGNINGDRERYMETFLDVYPDREVINCSVNFEKWKIFNSRQLATEIVPWLIKQDLKIAGGYVPLYDESYHQFGVIGAFPERDLPVRIRLYDWGIQFFVDYIVKK